MESSPFLVVGLGNPGEKYSGTRHNVGFEVVDCLALRWKATSFASKFSGLLADSTRPEGKVFLLKPQTYMNLSGQSVIQASIFFKIPVERCLVISDDVDLPTGQLRLRKTGGSGGHNGLKSLIEVLGEDFPRIRIGVGRDPNIPTDARVLGKISKSEREIYQKANELAADAVECFLGQGMDKAMNVFNRKV